MAQCLILRTLPRYLLNEGFEGAATPPTGWWEAYDGELTWHSPDVAHSGSKSLKCDPLTDIAEAVSPATASSGTTYGKFWVYFDHIPDAASGGWGVAMHTDGVGDQGHIWQHTNGRLRVFTRKGTSVYTTEAPPINTWVCVWWSYVPATGVGANDGVLSAWWSTDGVFPGNGSADHYVAASDGADTVAPDRFVVASGYAGTVHGVAYYDDIQMSNDCLW